MTAVFVAALATVVVGSGSALAKPAPPVPSDVSAAFAGPALRQVHAANAGPEADFPADMRAENVHEVFMFSPAFVEGDPTPEPLTSTDSWIGGIWRGDRAVGVLWVGKRDGGPAELQGFSADADLALTLAAVPPTDVFIDDAPSGSYYALAGTTARPLNDWARDAIPGPTDIEDLQTIVATQADQRVAGESDVPEAPGLGLALTAMGVALAVGGVLVVLRRRRDTRAGSGQSSTRHSPTTV